MEVVRGSMEGRGIDGIRETDTLEVVVGNASPDNSGRVAAAHDGVRVVASSSNTAVSSQLVGLGLGLRAVAYAPSQPSLARRLARAAGEAIRLPIAALYHTGADV